MAQDRSRWLASRFQRIRSDCPLLRQCGRPHPSFAAGPVRKIPSSLLANYDRERRVLCGWRDGTARRRIFRVRPPRLLLRPRTRLTSVLILPPTLEIRRRNLILGDGRSVCGGSPGWISSLDTRV